jgi:hypothetical protein
MRHDATTEGHNHVPVADAEIFVVDPEEVEIDTEEACVPRFTPH